MTMTHLSGFVSLTDLNAYLEAAFCAQITDTRAMAISSAAATHLTARYAHMTLTGLLIDKEGKSIQIGKESTQTSLKLAPDALYLKLTPGEPATEHDHTSASPCAPSQVHFIYRLLPKGYATGVSDLMPASSAGELDASAHTPTGSSPSGYQVLLKRLYINSVRVAWEE